MAETNITDYHPTLNLCYEPTHDKYYEVFSTVLNGYMTSVAVMVGTFGNIQGIRSVHMTNLDKNRGVVLAVSMLALGFWDTVLLWCAFIYYGAKKLPTPLQLNTDVLNLIMPYFHALAQVANTASIWCVVAITVQRFAATRDPFRTSRSAVVMQSFRSERRISFIYCSHYRRLFKMPFFLSLAAVILNLPSFFEIEAIPCFSRELNRITEQLVPTNLRTNPNYTWYRMLSRMVFVSIGPNIFILCLTVITIMILRGSNRSRRQLFQMSDNVLERYSSRENLQTMISVALVAKFLIFRSPTFVLDIIEVTVKSYNYYLIDASNFLVMFNSATNSLLFMKATAWLTNKYDADRQTIKRKKTICDSGQLLGDRLSILCTSWEKTMEMTNGQIGVNVAWNMIRKNPNLYTKIKPEEPEKVSLLNGSCKRSIDDEKLQEIGNRITSFIAELLGLMKSSQPEHYIVMRIRRVGAVHYDKGIVFQSMVWREFKNTIQNAISECQYPSAQERDAALESWNIFISFIIREMKMGMWAIGDTIGQMP